MEGKQEKLAVREIDLVPFVGEIKSYFDSMASVRAIAYTFTSSIKQCTLWIDPDLLEKVFVNLLSNAFKFTPEGGSVRIELTEGRSVWRASRDKGLPLRFACGKERRISRIAT